MSNSDKKESKAHHDAYRTKKKPRKTIVRDPETGQMVEREK